MTGKYNPADDPTAIAMQKERERALQVRQKAIERRQWAELARTYNRCIAIATATWKVCLEEAAAQQQALSEAMRDRAAYRYETPNGAVVGDGGHEIHVPLFTPRDRLQFLKEAAAALLIESGKRGLTVTPEVKDEAVPAQAEKANEAHGLEAQADDLRRSDGQAGPLVGEVVEPASGVDEADSVAPLALVPDSESANSGISVSQEATPSV